MDDKNKKADGSENNTSAVDNNSVNDKSDKAGLLLTSPHPVSTHPIVVSIDAFHIRISLISCHFI